MLGEKHTIPYKGIYNQVLPINSTDKKCTADILTVHIEKITNLSR